MGLIVDSSVIIASERRGDSAEFLLNKLFLVAGDQQAGLSSIGLTELVHGIYRARDNEMQVRRPFFIDGLLRVLSVLPYTKETALIAEKLDGEQQSKGITIPFADLLIGATALWLDFSVLTANPRHFLMIPGLRVVTL